MKSKGEVVTAFAPGKVILLGEHGVVYGYPAVAGAISQGVRATARLAEVASIQLGKRLGKEQRGALARAFATAMRQARAPEVKVTLESDLPLSMGLGSSAALSVAVARALFLMKDAPLNPRRVEAVALAMEKEFHGTPSGVDHTTSSRGQLVYFQRGEAETISARKPVKVLVAMVGPRSGTRATVAALRERQARWKHRYQDIFEHIAALVVEGRAAVERGDLDALGDIMNLNQGLLSALQLSSPGIEAMVDRLRGMGALGAKLTGAGGDGGAVIGLFPEPEPMVARLRKQGVSCFTSQLGGPLTL